MDRNSIYFKQTQLLVRVLPFIAKEKCFALKGGTAINLFIRDLPRLSVDIDLVYLPPDEMEIAYTNVAIALDRIVEDIKKNLPRCTGGSPLKENSKSMRRYITQNGVTIKIELSPVMRGVVFSPRVTGVTERVENEFGYAEIQVMDLPDLYAGKLCAALDRQHPRDLFDVKLLLENEGIYDNLRKAFLVYLISHHRPINEVLNPNLKDINQSFDNEFKTMTEYPVTIEELQETRKKLIETINADMTVEEKKFLLSFKSLSPEWGLLGLDDIEHLPAVKWKMSNLQKMSKEKYKQAIQKLKKVLYHND